MVGRVLYVFQNDYFYFTYNDTIQNQPLDAFSLPFLNIFSFNIIYLSEAFPPYALVTLATRPDGVLVILTLPVLHPTKKFV